MTTTPSSKSTSRVANRVSAKPTRHSQLRKLLTRKSGASIAQIREAFGWQPHTVRAAIAGQRKAGCEITRTETDKGSVYRIAQESDSQ